jgi:SagB-type dehydrogenase family enzyme
MKLWTSLFLAPALLLAGGLQPVDLPAPQTDGGKPFMQVLKERKSSRDFAPTKLPPQVLSNLLWVANGVNRPDGHRTAPSASNRQEIEIYVATADGLYLYEPKPHRLQPLSSEDLRAATGTQPFVKDAPVNLVYVADFAKMNQGSADNQILYSAADTGFISQNVYLFCASQGLATVVRGSVDRPALAQAMHLRLEQRIILAQTVGYPKPQ